jgi:hypothetical protein
MYADQLSQIICLEMWPFLFFSLFGSYPVNMAPNMDMTQAGALKPIIATQWLGSKPNLTKINQNDELKRKKNWQEEKILKCCTLMKLFAACMHSSQYFAYVIVVQTPFSSVTANKKK